MMNGCLQSASEAGEFECGSQCMVRVGVGVRDKSGSIEVSCRLK